MKKMWVSVAAAVLLMTGCASTGEADTARVAETAPVETAEEPAPLAVPEAPVDERTPEQAFLEAAQGVAEKVGITDATDEQLMKAGEDACAALASGTPIEQVTVIPDEPQDQLGYYVFSFSAAAHAQETICPPA